MRKYYYLLFLLISFACGDILAREKNHLHLGVFFPGAGFTNWNLSGNDLFFKRPDNLIVDQFKAQGLNIFYGIDILYGNRFKVGLSIGQEFIHVHRFNGRNTNLKLEPTFYNKEQTHFHKFLIQSEIDIHDKRIKWSINAQAGILLPERTFLKENIDKCWAINVGPMVSFWVSHKVDLFIKLSGEYKHFVHRAGQSYSMKNIILNQIGQDHKIENRIYSINLNFGARVNLLKKIRKPRFREEKMYRFSLYK